MLGVMSHRDAQRITVFDPCMPLSWQNSTQLNVSIVAHDNEQFTYTRKGIGNYQQCMRDIEPLLDKGALL